MKTFVLALVVLGCCGTASTVSAQTPTLKAVSFGASPDHGLTLSDGTVVVQRYELVLVKSSAPATPVATVDLGKPTPDATSKVIALTNVPLPAGFPSGEYIGRVAAVGPGGRSTDVVSPSFPKAGQPGAPTALVVTPQ
jgi:hypothetical protein